ncbi:hypothetical protein [Enterococcus sp. HY326]|uniref:hypothetical protein n=1 Tax=Enterococcus sp. HY326 TaxID=2971265 RepID=UPI00223EC3F5|nr:hypothetical protein [Enterococcus sp. HY326]
MKKQMIFLGLSFLLLSGCQKNEPTTSSSSTSTTDTISQSEASSSSTKISSTTTSTTVSSEASTNSSTAPTAVRVYSEAEKQAITETFLTWADSRAKTAGMAVNSNYFDHGASGIGDWYAVTSDGLIQVQQQSENELPGYNAFPLHSLGGIVWYYSVNGVTGITDEVDDPQNSPSTAVGFSNVADSQQPFTKYILADNGVVYEAQTSSAFSDGFYVAGDDGNLYTYYSPESQLVFQKSQDTAAQTELQSILSQYN